MTKPTKYGPQPNLELAAENGRKLAAEVKRRLKEPVVNCEGMYEDIAFDLLRDIVNLARDHRPYQNKLAELKDALKKAPTLRIAIWEAVGR